MGIPKEELHKITKAFYMVDRVQDPEAATGQGWDWLCALKYWSFTKSRLNMGRGWGREPP